MEKLNQLIIRNISDSKRQQTTTVDNKRLFNGLVLTRVVTLHRQTDSSASLPALVRQTYQPRGDTTNQTYSLITKHTQL